MSERGWIAANDEEDQSSERVNRSDATFDWDTPNFMVPGRRDLFVENDGERKENKRRWADIVLPIHLLIAANTLRRPLIIFEVASDGQEGSENWGALGGVFLPVSCSPAALDAY